MSCSGRIRSMTTLGALCFTALITSGAAWCQANSGLNLPAADISSGTITCGSAAAVTAPVATGGSGCLAGVPTGSNGTFLVHGGANVTFQSLSSVYLEPGFRAVADGSSSVVFHALIIPAQPPLQISPVCLPNGPVVPGTTVTCSANATGGQSPLKYLWSNAASGTGSSVSFVATRPGVNSVDVSVTDSIQNSISGAASVTVANALSSTLFCFSTSGTFAVGQLVNCRVTATGGTGGYTYQWTGGVAVLGSDPSQASLTPGSAITYNIGVTVSDSRPTSSSVSFQFLASTSAPGALSVQAAFSSPAVLNQPGLFSAVASGGQPPYKYYWSGAASNSSPYSNSQLAYTPNSATSNEQLTVTDNVGASVQTSLSVAAFDCGGISYREFVHIGGRVIATEQPAVCGFSVSPLTLTAPATTGGFSVSVTAPGPWTATVVPANATWLHLDAATGSTQPFHVDANGLGDPSTGRSATVSIATTANPGVPQNVAVQQLAASASIALTAGTTFSCGANSSSVQVPFLSNVSWQVTGLTWATSIPGNGPASTLPQSVTIYCPANTSTTARSQTLTVSRTTAGNAVAATFTVMQAGTTLPIISMTPSSATVDSRGGVGQSGTVSVTSSAPFNFLSCNQGWIHVSCGSLNSGSYTYYADQNLDSASRAGSLIASQDSSPGTNATLALTQLGLPQPTFQGVNPNSNDPGTTAYTSATGNFVFSASDPAGADTIWIMQLFFERYIDTNPVYYPAPLTVTNGCHVNYNHITQQITLYDDNDSPTLPIYSLGTGFPISNSQCTIDPAQSSVAVDPSDSTKLNVTVRLSFLTNSPYQSFYIWGAVQAGSNHDNSAKWNPIGFWTTPTATP